ncbi:hypothetical protein AusDCA_2433 [Desulfitobacterium sp. AusDCA]
MRVHEREVLKESESYFFTPNNKNFDRRKATLWKTQNLWK